MTAGPECHVFTMSNEHNKERSEGQRGERTVDDTFLPCKEFSEFKFALQQARTIDDKIVYNLNTSVPTQSFAGHVSAKEECMSLYKELLDVHRDRKTAITHCVNVTTQTLRDLKDSVSNQSDSVKKKLGMEQRKLRLMQSELIVEEVVQERSMKIFKERCWTFYKPPDM